MARGRIQIGCRKRPVVIFSSSGKTRAVRPAFQKVSTSGW
jgi:hypothetical protein